MGKGGNATPGLANVLQNDGNDAGSNLEIERKVKISKAPQFYWASGDAMEEPHVARYE